MSPRTKSPIPGSTLRPVSRSRSQFRTGRVVLLIEGAVMAALGVWGLIAAEVHPGAGPAGAPVLVLALTPAHSGVLLGFGVLAVLSAWRRRSALIVTGVEAVAFLLLFAIGTVASARSAPGPLGFDPADSVLHIIFMALNLALLMWLAAETLEGPRWVRRRTAPARTDPPPPRDRPREHAVITAPIDSLAVPAYTIPTDALEADGTLTCDSTTMVLVEARSGDICGTGWTYGPPACARVVDDQLADVVLGGDALDVGGAFDQMVKAVRNAGRPGAVGYAISARWTSPQGPAARVAAAPAAGRCRCGGVSPGDLRALRAAPARARCYGDAERAAPGVVPRSRPDRADVLRRRPGPHRGRPLSPSHGSRSWAAPAA